LPGGIEKHEDSGLRKEIIKKSSTSHFPQWMMHDWIGCCFHEMLTSSLQWAEANEDPCQQKKIGYCIRSAKATRKQESGEKGGCLKIQGPYNLFVSSCNPEIFIIFFPEKMPACTTDLAPRLLVADLE